MVDSTPTLKQRLGGRSIYLIGMMGSGKTSTGRPLAERLGYGFVDADAVIEQAAGCSIAEMFQRDGEPEFRALEKQVLNSISQRHSLVVATGGGVVTQRENWGATAQRHCDLAGCGSGAAAGAASNRQNGAPPAANSRSGSRIERTSG